MKNLSQFGEVDRLIRLSAQLKLEVAMCNIQEAWDRVVTASKECPKNSNWHWQQNMHFQYLMSAVKFLLLSSQSILFNNLCPTMLIKAVYKQTLYFKHTITQRAIAWAILELNDWGNVPIDKWKQLFALTADLHLKLSKTKYV